MPKLSHALTFHVCREVSGYGAGNMVIQLSGGYVQQCKQAPQTKTIKLPQRAPNWTQRYGRWP